MSAHPPIRRAAERDTGSEYYYRRHLTVRELMPALGAGIGVGLVAFYVMRIMLQRTPLRPLPVTDAARVAKREATSRSRLQAAARP